MITTIQLNESVRKALRRMKGERESYEDVIVRLMKEVEAKKRAHVALMIEGAKETAGESLKITKEFEVIDEDFDWEWKGEF